MENKLVVCIMGQNCEKFIPMCLESVKDADAIVYCDGGSTDYTLRKIEETIIGKVYHVIENEYNQEDPTMNGKQRNFYLNYLKEKYPDYWCLVLDADEVVEDLSKIKEMINSEGAKINGGLWSVKMRHFHNDLGHEDAINSQHYVLNRLFKISDADCYPEVEHPVLQGKVIGNTMVTTIWHLAHIHHCFNIKGRYEKNMKHSNIHSEDYLKRWYKSHLFGQYPNSQINPVEIPDVILNHFHIDKDELYFANRGLEMKHFMDAIHWKEWFNCKTAYEFGCGKGPRVYAMNQVGIEAYGMELSNYAMENAMSNVQRGDVTDMKKEVGKFDLVVAYDLLEHIEHDKLDDAINNLIKSTKKHILISVPVYGDPNLDADPTHVIRQTRNWWVKQFTNKELKLIPTPDHFLFKQQLMIFEK